MSTGQARPADERHGLWLCTCPILKLNTTNADEVGRNWSEGCPEHGLRSHWYDTTGREQMQRRNDLAVVAQAFAALARSGKIELAQAANAALDRLVSES